MTVWVTKKKEEKENEKISRLLVDGVYFYSHNFQMIYIFQNLFGFNIVATERVRV